MQRDGDILFNQLLTCMHIVGIKVLNSMTEVVYVEPVYLRKRRIDLFKVCLFEVSKVSAVTREVWRLNMLNITYKLENNAFVV